MRESWAEGCHARETGSGHWGAAFGEGALKVEPLELRPRAGHGLEVRAEHRGGDALGGEHKPEFYEIPDAQQWLYVLG